jgi:Ca2+-binding RTX toxin-like protein
MVTNTNDSGDGSLRQAILDSNATGGVDAIHFNIPGAGVQTIALLSPLPVITDSVIIGGYTQPGAGPNGRLIGDNATPLIELNGAGAGAGANGLWVTAGGCLVEGLVINRFSGNGIRLQTGGGNVIDGNFIGTDASGSSALPNQGFGILIDSGSSFNRVGTDGNGLNDAGERNLVVGKPFSAVAITGAGTDSNVVAGNYMGVTAAGTTGLGPDGGVVGISFGARFNRVGTNGDGVNDDFERNVLNAVGISHVGTDSNTVAGNYIGVNAAGTAALGNGSNSGVNVFLGARNNLIGGLSPTAGNVVSGQAGAGIVFQFAGTTGNVAEGNIVGLNAAGTAAVPNHLTGVAFIDGASGNTVGGAQPGARNVISGNQVAGVISGHFANSTAAFNNVVQGNFIGTDATGAGAIANVGPGVQLQDGTSGNQIGGAAPGEGNVIAFNTGAGILDAAGGSGNSFRGNSVFSNGGLGIDLGPSGVTANDAGDADTGPNGLQNFPTLSAVSSSAAVTAVSGSLGSVAGASYALDFYASPTPDASGFGEGKRYLGSTTVTTDAFGNAPFSAALPAASVGEWITATATDASGNTSEFSGALKAAASAVLAIDATGNVSYTASPGTVNSLTVAASAGVLSFSDPAETIVLAGPGTAGWSAGVGTAGGPLAGVTSVAVSLADQADAVGVEFVGVPVTLDGGEGSDTYLVDFGPAAGAVTVSDSGSAADADQLFVNGTPGPDFIVKDSTQVTLGNPVTETVPYSGIEHVTINGGGGNDTIIDPGAGATILGGDGDDTLIITASFGTGIFADGGEGSDTYVVDLGNLAGPVTVADSGLTGNDSAVVNGTAGDDVIGLTGNVLQSNNEMVTFASPLGSLRLDAGDGNDQVSVSGLTVPLGALTVDGGAGGDRLTASNFLAPVGSLALDGGAGDDALTVAGLGPQVAALTLDGGTGNTEVQIQGDLPPVVTLQQLPPTVHASAAVSLDEGSVFTGSGFFTDPDVNQSWTATVNYGDGSGDQPLVLAADHTFVLSHPYGDNGSFLVTVTVTDDQGGVGSDSFRVTVTNVPPTASAAGPADGVPGQACTFTFGADDPSSADRAAGFTYSVDWGDGSPVQTVSPSAGNGAGVAVDHVFAGVGSYAVSVTATDKDGGMSPAVGRPVTISGVALQDDPLYPGRTALVVVGTSGNDAIQFSPAGPGDSVQVTLNGVPQGVFAPTGRIVAYGLGGDDDIQVAGAITLPAWLYGGDGNDRLKGGAGSNVLLGGAGDDLLVGGSARDVLIGGSGVDRIVGNAADDLLVAGATAFDGDQAALAAVLAEWNSGRDYATRVANLMGTGSGPRLNGNTFLVADGPTPTVIDDGAADVLTGSAGQDWFFAHLSGTGVKDKVTDLSAAEFVADLSFILTA